ncbi:hypothetical protein CLAFUW4_11698 [Fulvia fulva]|nr:hypothetical protein CLAFUR4_11703 [Fulvia fulva]WPV17325.1 hypothetical protein CLAFUW4_11698 [Fulvia fulva]
MASAYSGRRFMDDSSFRSAPGSPIGVMPDIRSPYGAHAMSGQHVYSDALRSDYFGPGVSSFRSAPPRMPLAPDIDIRARYHTEDMIRRLTQYGGIDYEWFLTCIWIAPPDTSNGMLERILPK